MTFPSLPLAIETSPRPAPPRPVRATPPPQARAAAGGATARRVLQQQRVACLDVAAFALQRLAESAGIDFRQPLVLLVPQGGALVVQQLSPAAAAAGVRPGMRWTEARLLHHGLQPVNRDAALVQSAAERLAGGLLSLSPRVQVERPGCLWLEPPGRGDPAAEADFCARLLAFAAGAGLVGAAAGVADQALAAELAARHAAATSPAFHLVPPGATQAFLEPLPLGWLPFDDATGELLAMLGIRSLGAFAALTPQSIETRFGAAARALHALVRGRDRRGPRTPREPAERSASLTLEHAEERLDALLFLFKSALDPLAAGLRQREELAAELTLDLTLERPLEPPQPAAPDPNAAARSPAAPAAQPPDDVAAERRTVRAVIPTARAERLLALLRAHLEIHPLSAPLCGFRLTLSRIVAARGRQLDLFDPREPDPAALEPLLAQLSARCGPEALVQVQATPSWQNDTAARFAPLAEVGRAAAAAEPARAAPPASDLPQPAPAARAARLLATPRPLAVRVAPAPAPGHATPDDPPALVAIRPDRGPWRPVETVSPAERYANAWDTPPREVDFHWIATADGRRWRAHRDLGDGHFYLDGWQD